MKIVQTTLTKYFTINYNGKFYYLDYANSDKETSLLSNRDYWEVLDEEHEEVCIYEFQDATKEENEQIRKNRKLVNKLIKFCINHFNDYKPRIDIYYEP